MANDWQPYNPKPQIVPSDAGELWKHDHDEFVYMTAQSENGLWLFPSECGLLKFELSKSGENIIHNQNDWQRVFPLVPDDNVEEIIIEDVMFHHGGGIVSDNEKSIEAIKSVVCQNIKTMVLKIQKERYHAEV